MKQKKANISNYIAYFIDFSIQEIPHIIYIAYKIGGIVYTNSRLTADIIKRDHPDISVKYISQIFDIKKNMIESGVKIIIYPDYHIRYFKDLQGVKHVQVFHGISDKDYDYSKHVLDYDLFFIPGEYAYSRYRRKGLLKKNSGKLIGYPKFDRVFSGNLDKKSIRQRFSIDDKRPIVLYAPTWIDKSFNSSWKKFYKYILYDKPEWLYLIIKPHPNLVRYRKEEIDECKNFAVKRDAVLVLDDAYDITPILAISDLLLGDVSSVTREFLAFKKPMVFLSNKPKWLWKKEKIRLWDCGDVVKDPRKVWDIIDKSLENQHRFLDKIEQHFKETFYKPDGHAAERAAEEILRLIY